MGAKSVKREEPYYSVIMQPFKLITEQKTDYNAFN